jgi:site-specific recombinase XerD
MIRHSLAPSKNYPYKLRMKKPSVSLDNITGVRVGPLAEYLDAYITLIKEQHYSAVSTRTQIQLITKFNQWLRSRHAELYDLDESAIERFLQPRQNAGCTRRGDTAALCRLLHMLRQQGATRQAKKTPLCPQRRITTKYGCYLIEGCGLSQATVINYVPFIDQFLSERFRSVPFNLSRLRASDLTDFVQRHAHKLGVKRAQLLVSALRSFLRYLRHQGKVRTDLAVCVPTVARWSFATLPKFLPAGAIQRVLDHVDQQTAVGRRNYAILLLLARLGLRSCEIVALNLEDIDWENARITIRSKGGRLSQLPLSADVGRAVAQYLRHGRPRSQCRRVFIRDKAPRVGFANSIAISTLVMRALQNARVASAHKGAHLFRHSLATNMIRQGASLEEIGELLRHQSPNTTAIYAKVDLPALRPLALPWPGGAR